MRNEGTKAEGSEKGHMGKREKGLKRRNEISNEVVPIVSKSLSDAF